MAKSARGFVVAGTASGVGKTTVALALMAAFRKRGMLVQPFKCGPDFIDGGHHARACQRASRNLDGWMLSTQTNRECFSRAAAGIDACVVEGVMGLFDGVDGSSDSGSTAQIAKSLGLPVILVVDASSMARSVAALVHGFRTFDQNVNVAGVIFNKVSGPNHYRFLRDAISGNSDVVPLGYLRPDNRIKIPERYLGLITASEGVLSPELFALLAEFAEAGIDIDKLLELSGTIDASRHSVTHKNGTVRIGVARDKAFSFYYDDNLDALRAAGAEIVAFSPLQDPCLPPEIDALYFGGGYPELFAKQLTANCRLISAIRELAEAGLPIYAECGGLMYLGQEIVGHDGNVTAMARVLPIRVRMTDRLVNFGYTEVSLKADCILGSAGTKLRGHSFHCSEIIEAGPLEYVYLARNSMTGREQPEGLRLHNILASYIHLHLLSAPGTAEAFVQNVQTARSPQHTMATCLSVTGHSQESP
jgi:cobyrinic acid a,c-diamide synthase